MAVMQNMREYTKVILMLLVLAFVGTIIFDWGMNFTGANSRRDVIGKVNGAEITIRQYEQAYARERERFKARTGNEPSESEADRLREQAWDALVQDHLLQQAFNKFDLKASNQEIVYILFNDPPEFLKSQETFLNEQRQFDMAKYQAALNSGAPGQWRYVEDLVRQSLPYDKFQQRLQATIRVTEDEVKREYIKNNQKVKIRYAFVEPPSSPGAEVEVTDEMIETYYQEHKEDYWEDEKRQIEYVVFSTAATSQDTAAKWDFARDLLQRAKEGEDFGELAQTYSDDTNSKEKGGDLGYFNRGTMVKPFEEAAFSANAGDIVGPVVSNHGLHIIQVEDKRNEGDNEEVKARHILVKFSASSSTLEAAREDAQYLVEESRTRSFTEIAGELGKDIKSTSLFVQGSGFVPVLGLNKRASNFIFANSVGKVGPVEQFGQGFFVYAISQIQEARTRPLSEVKELISNKINLEQKMEAAAQAAERIRTRISEGSTLQEAAAADSVETNEISFGMSGFVQGIGREPNFIGAAFALEDSLTVSQPVKTTRGYYLIQLLEKEPFNEEDFESKRANLREQLKRRKAAFVFANWYTNAKEKADIEDLRSQLY